MVEKEKELGLFENRTCKIAVKAKNVTAFDSFENFLVFGDDKGNAYCYELIEKTSECKNENILEIEKGKIDDLKCHSTLGLAFFLINGRVHVLAVPKFERICKSDAKDIIKFTINLHASRVNEVAFVSKKQTKFMEYSHEMRKFIDSKFDACMTPDTPELVEWYKDWMILISKKKSYLMSTGGKKINIEYDISYAKSVGSSWLMYMGGTGIFMDKNIPKPQNTIDFGNKPLVSIGVFKNFVVSLHDTILKVFDGSDSANIQDVLFDHGSLAKFLSINTKNVFYLVQNFNDKNSNTSNYQLYQLKELAYEKQINKLLNETKFEDALVILNNNTSSADEEKPKTLENFFLDAAWSYLKKGDFVNSENYFRLTNFDPINLIFLFQNKLKMSLEDNELKKQFTLQQSSIESITSNNQELIKNGLVMCCNLLISKRNFLLDNFLKSYSGGSLLEAKKSNFNIQFTRSEHALMNINFGLNFNNILKLINTAIVKIMVICKYKLSKIKETLNSENFEWVEQDVNNFLNNSESSTEAKLVAAYLYEKQEKWDSSLKIWQEFGLQRESNLEFSVEACERTKIILTKSRDKDLFKEYISWMILKFSDTAFQLFVKIDLIQTEYFYTSIIGSIDKSHPDINIKEKFLEFYIASGSTTEKYHTMLCDLYIEKVSKLLKSEINDASTLDGLAKVVYNKLENLIRTTNHYNKVHILEKLKEINWMVDLEVYIYSQLSMHNDAIERLVALGCTENNFDKVEKYCNEAQGNKTDLFGELFKILTKNYKISVSGQTTSKNEKDKTSFEKNSSVLKTQILYLLKKYGDTQKLDVFLVLEFLPGDWLLNEQVLYEYLVKLIKNTNHMSNKYKLAKSLSEMSLLYKEKELIESKNKSVSVGAETNCELCKKKIGSTIFVVFPNMKIYHTKCATNLNVCPTSRTDFTKKLY